ncbi:unnamed protein product [Gadus morhua 'NCC']
MALQACWAFGGTQGPRVTWESRTESQAHRALKGPRGRTDQESPVGLESQESQDPRGTKDSQGPEGPLGIRGGTGNKVSEGCKAYRVSRGFLVFQGLMESRGPADPQAGLALQEGQDYQGGMDSMD